MYTDNTIITFGRHKGKQLKDVPDAWLKWYWSENAIHYKSGRLEISKTKINIMKYIESSISESELCQEFDGDLRALNR